MGTAEILVTGGVAALLGGVVGGGLKAFGIELPLLATVKRQVVAIVVGLGLIALGMSSGAAPSVADNKVGPGNGPVVDPARPLTPRPSASVREEIVTTPWLRLGLVQAGTEVRLIKRDLYTTEIRISRRPFDLLLPRRSDQDVYRIAAWEDGSIFRTAPVDRNLDSANGPAVESYFSAGTGIADTGAGSGILYLNDQGHNYLSDLRLGTDRDGYHVHYSSLFRDGRESRIEQSSGSVYLVVFYDADKDSVMENGEYEFLILTFED